MYQKAMHFLRLHCMKTLSWYPLDVNIYGLWSVWVCLSCLYEIFPYIIIIHNMIIITIFDTMKYHTYEMITLKAEHDNDEMCLQAGMKVWFGAKTGYACSMACKIVSFYELTQKSHIYCTT